MTLTEDQTATLSTIIQDAAIYNHWANETLVNWLKTKSPKQLEQHVASSFPGIRATLIHIWDTERFWLSVLKKQPAPPSFRKVGFDGTLAEVMEGITSLSQEFTEYVASLWDTDLTEKVYFTTPWKEGTQARFEFIYHTFNHSTYHRGQIITIGRQLGFTDAPMTDYNFYLLEVKPAYV